MLQNQGQLFQFSHGTYKFTLEYVIKSSSIGPICHSLLLIHPIFRGICEHPLYGFRISYLLPELLSAVANDLRTMLQVGDRCEVEPGAKRGTVKFVGRAEALGRGFWVGVRYDEPLGKHDGMYVHSQIITLRNNIPYISLYSIPIVDYVQTKFLKMLWLTLCVTYAMF